MNINDTQVQTPTQPASAGLRIRVGFEMEYDCPGPTPMLLSLNIHHSRANDLVRPDHPGYQPRRSRSAPTATCSATGAAASSRRRDIWCFAPTRWCNDSGLPDAVAPGSSRRRSSTCPNRRWFTCWVAAIARPISCPKPPGSCLALAPRAGRGCRRSAILSTSTLSLVTTTPGAPRTAWEAYNERRGRVPRLRPPGHCLLPLHEYSGALLHRLPG